jgi:outer membrane protein
MAKFALRALPIAVLILTAPLTWADDLPANTVRIGEYWIFYRVHADDLSGPFTPPGTGLDVKNTQTPYVAYLRRLSSHFSVEIAGGVPPLTKSVGKGPATLGSVPYNGQEISTARWLAPTALLEYSFLDDSSALRPYLGVGVNYTAFYDRDSTAAGNAAAGGPTRIELPSSFGPAATAGVTYQLSHRWNLSASYSVTRVRSRLAAITGDVVRTSQISFNPSALVVAAGYSF